MQCDATQNILSGGYRTGLFYSPHISSYRERMRVMLPENHAISEGNDGNGFNLHADINDRFIEAEEVVDILEQAFQVAKGDSLLETCLPC